MERDYNNYAPETLEAIDRTTLEKVTIGSFPMRLLRNEKITLSMEVYDPIEDFNSFKASSPKFSRAFPMTITEAHTDYPQFFGAIENAIFDWLGVTATDYALEFYDINLHGLWVRAKAVHKSIKKDVTRSTKDLAEFEQLKIDYPELVQSFYGFARTHNKRDANLAKFHAN